MSDYLEYLKDGDYNLWVTFLRDDELVHFFDRIDQQMLAILGHMNKSSELTARGHFYYQTLFWIAANRQLRNAFAAALRRMSYDAMLIVRPALECTVFAYRIFEDPDLLKVWADKREEPAAYAKHFRREPIPPTMPHASEFRKFIDRANEYASHPNLNYFSGSAEFGENVIHMNYFDRKNDRAYYLQVFTLLLYAMRILEVMRKTLESRLPVYGVSTEGEWTKLESDFITLKEKYRIRYNIGPRPS